MGSSKPSNVTKSCVRAKGILSSCSLALKYFSTHCWQWNRMLSYRLRFRDRRRTKTTSKSPSAFFTHSFVCAVIKCDSLLDNVDHEPVLLAHCLLNLGKGP